MHTNPEHDPEVLLRELRVLTLADQRKVSLRAELSTYADFHPATPAPIPSPFSWMVFARLRVPVALLLLLGLAGGTAYASGDALPGSPLYAVKVNVTEPIEVALATSAKEKAEVHAALAERRLEEAAELAVAEKLDHEIEADLEARFAKHVDAHLAAAETLEANGEETLALEVQSDLEARLVAHQDIFGLVEDHLEDSGENAQLAHASARTFIKAIRLRQEVVSEARLALERNLEDKATETETLALVTKASEAVSVEAKAVLLPSVTEYASEADAALAEAKESLEGGGEYDARRAFRKALEAERASAVVSTLLKHRDILMQVNPATTTPETATTTEATPEEENED